MLGCRTLLRRACFKNERGGPTRVFSADDGGHEDSIPSVTWPGQKSFQVTIKKSPFIGRQDAKSEGFDISYKIKN